MIFVCAYATIEASLERTVTRDMEEKTYQKTDTPVAQDADCVSDSPAAVQDSGSDETTAQTETTVQAAEETVMQAETSEQAVAVREDKTPADEQDDLDEEDDDEEDDDDTDEDADAPAEEEAETPPPYCDKVFGMHRLALYGICFGYGGGLLLTGLFGLVTGIEVTTSSIPGIIGAVIGYFIGQYATKRLLAKAKAEAEAAQAVSDPKVGQE